MKKIIRTFSLRMAIAATTSALIFSASSLKAQFYFQGRVDGNIFNASNYYGGTAPAASNTQDLVTQSSYNSIGLDYVAANGTTTFGDLDGGESYADTGGNQVQGGTLNFTGTNYNIIGYNDASSFTVDGGTVNFLGTGSGGNDSLLLGDLATGTLSLTSGLITTTNNLSLSFYGGGAGVVNVSGGTFNVKGTGGTLLDQSGSTGTGTLNFLAGNGVFEETASTTFASGIKVAYSYQTNDQFTLTGTTATGNATFAALAAAGKLYYQESSGGSFVALTSSNYLNYFSVIDTGTTETLIVAPEPSTWALMLGGLGILAFIQRRRSLRS